MIRAGNKRSGVALLLSALICLAMVPLVGLAIDGANAYLLRAQISAALDGAVLAGARSLSGTTTQSSNAGTIAQQVFTASLSNLNTNISSTVATSFCTGSTSNSAGCAEPSSIPSGGSYRWVTGTATANLPLSMLALIPGLQPAPIKVIASAQRQNVNLMLVLDHSYAMNNVLSTMQQDATTFVNMFADQNDSLGLVTYSGAAVVDYTPATTFLSDSMGVPYYISQLAAQASPFTSANAASAIWAAYQQLQAAAKPGYLNVIVLFTGGLPYAFTGDFTGQISGIACLNGVSPLIGTVSTYEPSATWAYGISASTDMGGLVTPGDENYTIDSNPPYNTTCSAGSVPKILIHGLNALPAYDVNNNATGYGGSTGSYVNTMPSTVGPLTVLYASENAFDAAATTSRANGTYIYTIGLFDPSLNDAQPDPVLLAKVANDPSSPSYVSGQPTGLYIQAPTIAQINSAFSTIASQVLKLAQ